MRRFLPIVLLVAACTGGGGASDPTPTPTASPTGTATPTPTASPTPLACSETPDAQFPATWIDGDGGDCATEVDFQVHRYDADTFVVRQSLCTHFEGPFVYLLFGAETVLLEDTGASTNVPFKPTIDGIISQVLAERGQASIERIVVNSHGHGDHTANNAAFAGDSTVVGTSQASVATFFGIGTWPTQIVEYDLGNRVLDVIPIPGHQTAHIAFYDRRTGILLTGDTLYPGRLYISAFDTYRTSIQRLVDFTATREVCHILGTHIEMSTTPEDDFPAGSQYHPSEHVLRLTRDHLLELDAAVDAMAGNPVIEPHDDFIVYPL